MTNDESTTTIADWKAEHHHRKKGNRMLMARNIINTLFMVCAIIGVVFYLKVNRETGIYIICASMVLKFIESAIRLLKL